MNEHQVEERLRIWFTTDVGRNEVPASLVAAVDRIPDTTAMPHWRLPIRPRPIVVLVLTAVMLLALIGSLVIVGALVRDRTPTPLGVANGWIAYATEPGFGGDDRGHPPSWIYLVREGVMPRMIAGSVATSWNLCPAFSPDGTMLAYGEGVGIGASLRATERTRRAVVILTFDAEGSVVGPPVRLPVAGTGYAPCPSWAPDGQRVAFVDGGEVIDQDGTVDGEGLVIMALDGTSTAIPDWDQAPTWHNGYERLAWSPDGTTIAVARRSGTWLVPLDGRAPFLLRPTGGSETVSWSPDGTRIAVEEGGRALLVSVVGHTTELGSGTRAPLWSPAGDRIAYGTGEGIVVANPDGSDAMVVVNDAGSNLATWSPDGRSLLHIRYPGGWDLLSTPVEGAAGPGATVTLVPDIPVTGLRSYPRRGDVSWQPVIR